MRSLFLLLGVILIYGNVIGQCIVTKVNGSIKRQLNGEHLSIGSSVKDDEILIFQPATSSMRVSLKGKGVFLVSPSTTAEKKENLVFEMLKSSLHIQVKTGSLTGRSRFYDKIPEAVTTNENINIKLLIAERNPYLFDTLQYRLIKGNSFILQINNLNGSPVIKQLKVVADTLFLLSSDFNLKNGVGKGQTYFLGYYNSDKGSTESIAEIDPIFEKKNEMEVVIKTVLEGKYVVGNDLRDRCYEEVYYSLGKPSDIIFDLTFFRLSKSLTNK